MNRQIATFWLGDTLLGVEILLIKEVYRHMTISSIPDAPEHLRGLMNLRGRVVTVIDLNVCLNRPPVPDITDSRLLIFKTQEDIMPYRESFLENVNLGEDIVGFLIDRMGDVLSVEEEDILPPPPHVADINVDLIKGVIKQGDQLVILLDVTAVLDQVMDKVSNAA